MPIILIAIVAVVFGVIYCKASLWINIILFIVDLFIVDPIPLVDELFMLVVVLSKVKKVIDLVKKGMTVKKAVDFVNKVKKDIKKQEEEQVSGCGGCLVLLVIAGIVVFLLTRTGCI